MSPQLNLLRSTSSSRLGARSTEYSVLLQAADRTQAKPCRSCRRRRRRGRREAERCCASRDDSSHAEFGGKGGGKGEEKKGPWSIGLYHTKRKTFATTPLGDIPDESYDTVTEPVGWTPDAKLALAIECVARELEVEEEFVRKRLEVLQKLVPDLKKKLKVMKVGDLARLAVKVPDIANKLLTLKEIFPQANISHMVSNKPELLMEDTAVIAEKAKQLRVLLETDEIDRAVELNPTFLSIEQVEQAIEEISRLMPNVHAPRYLIMNPNMLFSMQTGDNLIPYDNGTLKQLKASLSGGEGAAPKGW